jgi:hypothetical protein
VRGTDAEDRVAYLVPERELKELGRSGQWISAAVIVVLQYQMAAIHERSMLSLDFGDDPGRRLKIGRSYPVFTSLNSAPWSLAPPSG